MKEQTKQYISELIHHEGELYDFKCKAHDERHIPVITDDVLQMMRVLIESHNVKSILEIGSAVGASAMLFASFMGEDCHVTTIERDDALFLEASTNIKNFGYENKIEIIHGDASEELKKLDKQFDLIFLDGNKGHYIYMLNDCVRLLKTRGLLIGDNILFRGMVSKTEPLIRRKITIVKRLRKFLTAISERDDLISSTLPIGDGMSISVKR